MTSLGYVPTDVRYSNDVDGWTDEDDLLDDAYGDQDADNSSDGDWDTADLDHAMDAYETQYGW
jgi:hypothetical protein